MPNPIKFNTEADSNSLRIGNFNIGTNNVPKGPTSSTGFFNGINPSVNGYTIYLNKASNGPSILTPSSDAQLITMTNQIAGTSYTTIDQCFLYYEGQSDKMVMHNPINGITTDGLVLFLSSDSLPSYPRSGTSLKDISGTEANWTIPSDAFDNGVMNYTSQQSVLSPPSAWQSTTDLTVEVLYKPNTGGVYTGCCDTIFGRYDFRFFQIGASLYTMIGFDDGNGTRIYQHPAYSVSYDKWHHILAIRRNNRYIIWIDGVERYNTTYGTGLALWDPTETYYISSTRHTNIDYAACRIYNKGLSDSEILQNYYQSPIVTDGLIFAVDAGNLVSFERGSTTTYSLKGSETGTLTNGVDFETGFGGTWDFDGVDDYIDVGDNCPTGNFSISSWVYKEGTGGWYAIFSAGTEIWFGLNNNGRILAHVGGPLFQVTGAVDINVWAHCVLTWDGTTGRIYVDGVEVASSTSLDNPIATGYDIGRLSTSTAHNIFYGKISQVQLYDGKVLSAEEVQQNYQANINRFN